MGGSNENAGMIIHSNIQGRLKTAQAGHNRKALSTIDSNIRGAAHKKGVLTEKNVARNKNSVIPVHRPVTRKFAAELAGKQHQDSLEEVKPPSIQPILSAHQSSDCIITDAEDYRPTNDHDVPMFVQHTEAMLEEIDHMDAEVEMEDLDEDEPVADIDSCDKKNPLAVTEYIDEMYVFYKKTERSSCVSPNYMAQQFDINERMRGILIDWLIEVHYKFELMDETLYLTVNLIDRFLAVQSIVRKKLQLVGVTAMLLACKYEEVSVPVVDDLILISDKAYCRKEVLDMEKLMINTLQFNLSVPTPYVFMRRLLKAAQSDKRLLQSLQPSALSGSKQWSKTCEKHTNYSQDQLMECARLMVTFHQKAGNGKLTGVYKKYSTSKHGYAAKTDPAVFLIDADSNSITGMHEEERYIQQ